MLRGEIRLVDLEPARAGEADKRRPAIIVSNNRANTVAARLGRGVVTVVPVTSNTARVFPFQVLLTADEVGIRLDSKAQAEQVRAVSVDRIGPVIGRLPAWSPNWMRRSGCTFSSESPSLAMSTSLGMASRLWLIVCFVKCCPRRGHTGVA